MQLIQVSFSCLAIVFMVGCDQLFRRDSLNREEFIKEVIEARPADVDHLRYYYSAGVGGFGAVARFAVNDADWIDQRFPGADVVECDAASEQGRLRMELLKNSIVSIVGDEKSYQSWMRAPDAGIMFIREIAGHDESLTLIAWKGERELLLIAFGR